MVVVEDLGLQPARAERRADVAADDDRALGRIDPHPRIGIGLEVRLVLDRQHRHRHAFAAERLDRSREIVGEGRIILRLELALDQAPWSSSTPARSTG
jgi:hypothetical protein